MRSKWLKAISRKDFNPNDKSNSTRVCSKHFKEDDFIPNKKNRRLKRTSVPSIFPCCSSYQIETEDKPRTPQKRHLDQFAYPSPKRNCQNTSNADMEDAELLLNFFKTASQKATIHIEPISADVQNTEVLFNFSEIPPNETNSNIESISEDVRHAELLLNFTETIFSHESNINIESIKNFNNQNSQTKLKMTTIEKLQHENRKLKKLLDNKSKTISVLKEKNKCMSDKLEYYKNNIYFKNLEKMQVLEGEGLASTKILFLLTLIRNFSRKTPRWPESIIRECIMLRAVSPKGYKMIIHRNLLKLPSITTLNRYIGPVNGDTGFSDLIKERLQQEIQTLKPIEKMCSLIIDEMCIKPQGIYD